MKGAGGAVLVVVETRDGSCDDASGGAIAAAGRIARARGCALVAAVFGHQATAAVERVALAGVDRVLVADHVQLSAYALGAYRAAALAAVEAARADIVVMAASAAAWDLAPRLAAALDAAYVSDVRDLAAQAQAQRIVCERDAFGGKLRARLLCTAARAVLTVDASAFDAETGATSAAVTPLPASWLEAARASGARTVGHRTTDAGALDLGRCDVIVAGGRGAGDAERFRNVILPLADALGAGVAASRPVVDAGWVQRAHQVGSSGQVVKPRLYVACGISGAAQHLAGMRGSGYVVAINKDRRAPIFAVADLAVVADLHEVVPALTDALRARKR